MTPRDHKSSPNVMVVLAEINGLRRLLILVSIILTILALANTTMNAIRVWAVSVRIAELTKQLETERAKHTRNDSRL